MAGTAVYLALGAGATYFVVRSAKQQLAKFIANSINSVFDVDPDDIEASLVKSSKFTLNQVRLKPQVISRRATLEGEVERVEFSWNWGKKLVRDAMLSIRGARFRMVTKMPEREKGVEGNRDDSLYQSWSDSKPRPTKEEVEVGGTVQQILDQLTIRISDIKLVIETEVTVQEGEPPLNVVLEAKSFRLESLGRQESEASNPFNHGISDSPLLQRLHMDSVWVFLADQNGRFDVAKSDALWLLEPLGYKATIKRASGKRFAPVLDPDLEVLGEVTTEQGIIMHVGKTQICAFLRILEMILPDENGSSIRPPRSIPTEEEVEDDAVPKKQLTPSHSLLVILPIPTMKLILPNSLIKTHNWQFRYRADGTECALQGTRAAVFVNEQYYRFIQFEDNARCHIDFSRNKITLDHVTDPNAKDAETTQSSEVPGAVARVEWQEIEMKRVREGIRQVMALTYASDDSITSEESNKNQPNDSSLSVKPWSLATDGTINLRIEGGDTSQTDKQWIEASLTGPSFVLPDRMDTLPSHVSVRGATFGPTSFGDVSFRMSSATLAANSVQETVLGDLHQFALRVFGIDV